MTGTLTRTARPSSVSESLFARPSPLPARAGDEDARVAAIRRRTRAEITHPDRVLFPAAGLTRLDEVEEYLRVDPSLLPCLHGRPLTLHRLPDGLEGNGFFEKDARTTMRGYVFLARASASSIW